MDCTPEFNGAMANAIFIGSYGAVRLITPLQWCEKWQIAAIGGQIPEFPFDLTYSCYNGGHIHCGVCPTCIGRRLAFLRAQIEDPTPYARTPEDMPSPGAAAVTNDPSLA